jgi:hypothetical protein
MNTKVDFNYKPCGSKSIENLLNKYQQLNESPEK